MKNFQVSETANLFSYGPKDRTGANEEKVEKESKRKPWKISFNSHETELPNTKLPKERAACSCQVDSNHLLNCTPDTTLRASVNSPSLNTLGPLAELGD